MLTRLFNCGVFCLVSAFFLIAVVGCAEKKEQKPADPAKAAEPVKAEAPSEPVAKEPAKTEAAPQAEVEAMLAKADLLDGKADKIVTRCASCALNMDGSSDHTLKALDYTMHFCTEKCATGFGKDLTKSILAMKIPEG